MFSTRPISYRFAHRVSKTFKQRHARRQFFAANPPLQSTFRISYLWYAAVLALGASAGLAVRNFAAPLPLPQPGSREDKLALEALTADIDKLDIVKSLRAQGYHLHSDTPLNEVVKGHKGWVELDIKQNITESKDDRDKERITRTVTWQSMAGSRGLGIQRAFWNSETKELVAVVWIGAGLSGWPGLAHGGAIATIFEDSMSRMVAGPNVSLDSIHRPTSMSVTYAKPTNSTDFYVLRASYTKPKGSQTAPPPEPESEPTKSWLAWLPYYKDLTKKASTGPRESVEITGTLETLGGQLCVKAKGTFPVAP